MWKGDGKRTWKNEIEGGRDVGGRRRARRDGIEGRRDIGVGGEADKVG